MWITLRSPWSFLFYNKKEAWYAYFAPRTGIDYYYNNKNMTKYLLPFFILLSVAFHAGAQEAALGVVATTTKTETTYDSKGRPATPKSGGAKGEVRQEIRTLKQDTKGGINQLREGLQKEIKGIKQTIQTQVKTATRTPGTLKELQQKREEFKDTIKAKREETAEKIKAMRADLKVRLQKVKDEQKRNRVEKISEQIDALNKKELDHFSDLLDKMEKTLERIGSRADKAESRGLNVSVVRAAMDDAHAAIEASRVAITAQAGKTYTIEVTTEEVLKADVGKARKALRDDLAKVRGTVKAAHDAVRNAAVILAQIPRVDEETTATPTTPISPATSTEPTPPPAPPAPSPEATSTATSSEQ